MHFLFNLLAATVQGGTAFAHPGAFGWKGYFATVFGVTHSFDKTFTIPTTGSAEDIEATRKAYEAFQAYEAASQVVGTIETVLWILIGVVGLAAIVYSIFLGFQLARASEQGKRDEAKKHLITVIIAIVVTLVLVIFFLYLLPGILGAFHGVKI